MSHSGGREPEDFGSPVRPGTATDWELHARLPPTVPAEEIRAINKPNPAIHTHRTYSWNRWDFDLPPGVFHPGETSRLVHARLLDGTLPVAGLRYAAMGCGLGVEAVVAGVKGAAKVYALDVRPESVRTTARHYEKIVGADGPPLVPLVADVLAGFPEGEQVDVVTFNPPGIDLPLTDDPDIVRNLCVGPGLAARFFDQLVARDLLAPGGVVYLIVSNTAPLRDIVAYALEILGATLDQMPPSTSLVLDQNRRVQRVGEPLLANPGIGSSIEFRNVRHELYDRIHWVSFDHARAGAVALLRDTGIFAGLSSGAVYLAAGWEREQAAGTVVFVAPDTGHRYVPTVFAEHADVPDIGACAFEAGEVAPGICVEASGSALADLLRGDTAALRVAALDAYLGSLTPHRTDPRASRVELPVGTPEARGCPGRGGGRSARRTHQT